MSRKKLLAGLVLLTTVCLYLAAATGCHPAPPRPHESQKTQTERQAKKGGD